jgi:glutamyl-tRNA synthetase
MRGRFAPSPTGDLHLGNARTALLAWLQVRRNGGSFVLRMEDLDRGRVRDVARQEQLRDLRWLGLDWDEGPDVGGARGPYEQRLRTDRYDAALQRLRESGLLYECFCSRREIAAAASAPHGGDEEGPVYPGTCRDRIGRSTDGPPALRFRTPDLDITFHDEVQGERTYRPYAETGDFVVRRKDGVAAYQLAVVVDDAAMRITEVLRGADLLSSTARQILLYQALGLEIPRWSHVPLILGADGQRLAKRHGALPLRGLRERGVSPRRVVGWLAATCGLAGADEELTPADLLERLDLTRLPRPDTRVTLPGWLGAR